MQLIKPKVHLVDDTDSDIDASMNNFVLYKSTDGRQLFVNANMSVKDCTKQVIWQIDTAASCNIPFKSTARTNKRVAR